MAPFWSFRIRFRRAYYFAYRPIFDFRFSLGRKRLYDSDSVTSPVKTSLMSLQALAIEQIVDNGLYVCERFSHFFCSIVILEEFHEQYFV